MKKFLLIAMCIAMSATFASCKKQDEQTTLAKIQKSLVNLETYSAIVQITQKSNKGEKTYEVRQDARKTGEYRIIVTAPEKIADTVTIFNGTATFQFNPRVNGSLKIDLPKSQVRDEILLTSFIKNYLNSEETAIETSKQEGGISTVLEAAIPGTNPYMKTEKLWISNETLMPQKLVIYDETNVERIVVTYKKIEYNTKLGDEIFTISTEKGETATDSSTNDNAEEDMRNNAESNAKTPADAETNDNKQEEVED